MPKKLHLTARRAQQNIETELASIKEVCDGLGYKLDAKPRAAEILLQRMESELADLKARYYQAMHELGL